MLLVEADGLSGALLDQALGDCDCSVLCARLKRRIPFMVYSGFDTVEGACVDALHLSKPATHAAIVAWLRWQI